MSTCYKRTFWVQASHFNSAHTYELWRTATAERDFDAAVAVLKDCHGHNFKIIVEGWAELDKQGFVFEDEAAEQIVHRWDNTNLSVLDEFGGGLAPRRVSLEWMCEQLAATLRSTFEGVTRWRVTIHETEFISASYEVSDV